MIKKVIFYIIINIISPAYSNSIDHFAQALQSLLNKTHDSEYQKLEESLRIVTSKPLNIQLTNGSKTKMMESYEQECEILKKYNALVQKHDQSNLLRIVTYNVHMWLNPQNNLNLDEILAVLKKIDADIVCLQEMTLGQSRTIEEITKKFNVIGYDYGGKNTFSPYHGPNFGNIIFSKYKLTDIIQKHYDDGHKNKGDARSFVGASITFKGTLIRVYCTHLDVYDKTGKRRKVESEELTQHIAKNDPKDAAILVIGDFNDPRSRDYESVLWKKFTEHQKNSRDEDFLDYTATTYQNAGYTDAYESLKKRPPFTSWTGTIIDFAYLRNNGPLKFKDVNVYFDAASDHLPVLFDLVLA